MRVLVIEDEMPMRAALVPLLSSEGYHVECAEDGPDGLQRALDEDYALILLDVMLPGLDGFALCRELRRRGREVPVLMMTARGQIEDRVAGLDGGADDYLVKPFRGEELLARMRALLRRAEVRDARQPVRLVLSGAVIDFQRRTAERDGEPIPLRAREIAMLEVLARAAGGVVTREEFLDRLWPSDAWPSPRTIDNHILSIRSKLEPEPNEPRHILTMHRSGYRLEADEIEMTDRRQLGGE